MGERVSERASERVNEGVRGGERREGEGFGCYIARKSRSLL